MLNLRLDSPLFISPSGPFVLGYTFYQEMPSRFISNKKRDQSFAVYTALSYYLVISDISSIVVLSFLGC